MPYQKNGVRNYREEYDKYHSRPEQIKNRSKRTTARRQANEDGRTSKGDGTNLDHKVPLSKGGSNGKSNLRVVSESQNKSFARNRDGSLKSQRSRKGK